MFIGTVNIDMRRFPDIADRLERHVARTDRYFLDMIDLGISTGEIRGSTGRSPPSSSGSS